MIPFETHIKNIGAPLIYNKNFSEKPYLDWKIVASKLLNIEL